MLAVTRHSLPQFAVFLQTIYGAEPLGALSDRDVCFFLPSTTDTLTLMFDGELATTATTNQQWLQGVTVAWNQYRSETEE